MSVGSVGQTAVAVEALVEAELNALAAGARALEAQLQPGDVVAARVLPSNGLTDQVEILGSRVAASLPPTLQPGDVVQVQVTSFDGSQIFLQILETPQVGPDPGVGSSSGSGADVPPDPGNGRTAPTPPPVVAASSETPVPTSAAASAVAAGAAAAPPLIPSGASTASLVARPTAVFVTSGLVSIPAGRATSGPLPGAPTAAADTGPQIPPAARAVPFPITTGLAATPIEARLAAARAGAAPPSGSAAEPPATAAGRLPAQPGAPGAGLPPAAGRLPAQPGAALPPAAGRLPAQPGAALPPAAGRLPAQPGAPGAGLPPARPFVPPPPITASSRASADPARAPAPPAADGPAPTPAAPAVAGPPSAAYRDPVQLVRALGLPVTPGSVAAAKLALDNPQRLPNALATLESALPDVDDPRVATLRTITAFVSRIEPSSPELASQIASYVENVVDGGEAKLATALAAHAAAGPQAPAAGEGAPGPGAPAPTPVPLAPEPPLPVAMLANAFVRGAALLHDLKLQLFSLLAGPPSAAGDELIGSAASALTAITGGQLSTADTLAATPQIVAFTLPLWTGTGYTQARIAVDRDAPEHPGVPLDGDNFHIAFVLDTKNLGTVAIDLQAVGRTLSLAVKTEASGAAERFGTALGRLTERLAKLNYRVASADAAVARSASPADAFAPPADPADAPAEPSAPGELNVRA